MEPEMNAPDSHTLLIEKIKALEEAQVLALVRERIQSGDDPLKIIESAQEGMRQVGSLYEQKEYFISGLMMAGEIFREVMEIVKESGGMDKLHMAFYQQGDLQSDKVWDMWRVEGPSFVWHFRGAPHVHAYINIGHKKA